MTGGKKLYFAVTNDLSFDQRMIRICTTLAAQGYMVTLVGRKRGDSIDLKDMKFSQKRLHCFFNKGILFYAEFNLRLFVYFLLEKPDLVCAIDLDTIIPCYFISKIKRAKRVYDAHELFCEMKEIVTRPRVYKIWKRIEQYFVPEFKYGYTVNDLIAREFANLYGANYTVIRNLPVLLNSTIPEKKERYILYQGAVNEGRSFETLIPAMKKVEARLIICGDGNFMQQAKHLVREHQLEHKVIFEGKKTPQDLLQYTLHAWAGITLFENLGLSNYLSLGNRFFDYMHAGIPQVCVNYPLYRSLNSKQPFALLIDKVSEDSIGDSLNRLLREEVLYHTLQQNCLEMRLQLNWQKEEILLIAFYKNLI